jgi:hypothetical protein
MSRPQSNNLDFQQPSSGPYNDRIPSIQDVQHAEARVRSIIRSLSVSTQKHRRPPPVAIQLYTVLSTSEAPHDSECPICHENYDDDQHLAIKLQETLCSHVIGQSCLQNWVNSGMGNAHHCPSCRQSIIGALGAPISTNPGFETAARQPLTMQEREQERTRQWATVLEVRQRLEHLETILALRNQGATWAPPVEFTQQPAQTSNVPGIEQEGLVGSPGSVRDQRVHIVELLGSIQRLRDQARNRV